VPIKSWTCPSCQRPFIVDAEAARDTCPWCNTAVEQRDNELKVIGEAPRPAEPAPVTPETPPSGPAGSQAWWPFEYSS
jgi:hypothetical protein